MPISSPGMGKYQVDDDPLDLKDQDAKNYKSGFWRGGLEPPATFKPILQVDIKTGKTPVNKLGLSE